MPDAPDPATPNLATPDLARRRIGETSLEVPAICFGTAPLGDMPETYGYTVSEEDARATVRAILGSPFPFLDTSRNYGMGRSEERVGAVISQMNGLPHGAVLSTKLDRDADDRFGRDQARRSLEASLKALNVDRVDILHLHDPEHCADVDEVVREAVPELLRIKEEGLATAVGLAAGKVDVMMPILAEFPFDCIITHNRFTLVNRNAEAMIDFARSRGASVLNAAPYAAGALVHGTARPTRYVYQEPTEVMLVPVRRVEEVCARHEAPLGAAALRFSLGEPRVTSTIVGVSSAEHVERTLKWAAMDLPEGLADDLAALPATTDDPEATRDYKLG